ncbi:Down syndrome cell adhesion molecule-like protein Dscam2, partial [Nilaparvata lugens]|uniref:Down syndrome cell adhesion molecule-like protein Dscam2 n=1 Tax=Nilaparvata lugens TaxID=108931 RepID=UPI00193D9A12
YKLSYQYAGSRWQHISLEADRKNYVLGNLLCGTKYELYLKAFNSVGESPPSTIIRAATKGQAPGRSEQDEFVTVNSTSAMLFGELAERRVSSHLQGDLSSAWRQQLEDIRVFNLSSRCSGYVQLETSHLLLPEN